MHFSGVELPQDVGYEKDNYNRLTFTELFKNTRDLF